MGYTSTVDIQDFAVRKTVHTTLGKIDLVEHSCFEREVHCLNLLKDFDWAPKLIVLNERTIVMTNVGVPISNTNAPVDACEQMEKILSDLKSVGVKHNDIKKKEILVKHDKIHLCDFGWSSLGDDFSFGKDTMSSKEKPHGIIDDRKAISICEYFVNQRYGEQHLIIDWSRRLGNEKVKSMIEESGLILTEKYALKYNDPTIASRFYGVRVNDERFKSSLDLYLVIDPNPVYAERKTTKGLRQVNTTMFDLKKRMRKLVPGYRIHATDNIQETKDNLRVLQLKYKSKKFRSVSELFESIKSLKYVVMRNFEGFPDKIQIDEHLDIDILCEDYYEFKRAVDGDSARKNFRYEDGEYRILNWVSIAGKKVMMDIRFVGDDYYDKRFENDMLSTRIFDADRGIWIPNEEYHKNGLIYHALIHKDKVSDTYAKRFKEMSIDDPKAELKCWMEDKKYSFVRPKDKSVKFNTYV